MGEKCFERGRTLYARRKSSDLIPFKMSLGKYFRQLDMLTKNVQDNFLKSNLLHICERTFKNSHHPLSRKTCPVWNRQAHSFS